VLKASWFNFHLAKLTKYLSDIKSLGVRRARGNFFSDCAAGRGARDVSVLRCGKYPWLAAVWIFQSRITRAATLAHSSHPHPFFYQRDIKFLSTWPSDRLRFGCNWGVEPVIEQKLADGGGLQARRYYECILRLCLLIWPKSLRPEWEREPPAGFCLFVGALLNLQFRPRNKLLSRLGEAAAVTQAKQIVCVAECADARRAHLVPRVN
jgi:hypothetical protein